MSDTARTTKFVLSCRAVAIVSPSGIIHIDKIAITANESWGLLVDERHTTVDVLKLEGWRCTRIVIKPIGSRRYES